MCLILSGFIYEWKQLHYDHTYVLLSFLPFILICVKVAIKNREICKKFSSKINHSQICAWIHEIRRDSFKKNI